MSYSIAKGVFDILPQDPKPDESWRNSDKWHYVESVIREITLAYGFKEIRTPIFEHTELFLRAVGETSDIVSKEMYTFEDRGERKLALRPEGTAGVMRAFVEKSLQQISGIHKLYYVGPMFRYERPQAGRYRQHHQFGVEAIGVGAPEQDVEVIDLLCSFYRRLGLKNLTVHVNSIGDRESRDAYALVLQHYLRPHFEQLSPESKIRFERNPLRILDSKDPKDRELLINAPSLLNNLNEESRVHFERVCTLLEKLGIAYTVNPKLVRGLDYYNKTVFEVTSGELGAQNSMGGGGRFDGLIESFGGPNLPACGFGCGLERVIQSMIKQECFFPEPPHPFVFIAPLGEECILPCFQLLHALREENIPAEMDLVGKKLQHALQRADLLKAVYCLVIGESELSSQKVKIKNMKTRETSPEIALKDITAQLKLWKKTDPHHKV